MGADNRRLFRHVILPGALAYVLTACGSASPRHAHPGGGRDARAVPWAWVGSFSARGEFLNTDVMLAGIAVIGRSGSPSSISCSNAWKTSPWCAGDDGVMTASSDRTVSLRRAAITVVIAAGLYEAFARSGAFPPALLPTCPPLRAGWSR